MAVVRDQRMAPFQELSVIYGHLMALSINRLVYNRCGYGNFVPTILSVISLNTGDVLYQDNRQG